MGRLLAAGALDAWLEPVVMKRGRGAYKVCALVRSGDRERLARLLMRETGSLGVRHLRVGRTVAERRIVEVELPYGSCPGVLRRRPARRKDRSPAAQSLFRRPGSTRAGEIRKRPGETEKAG